MSDTTRSLTMLNASGDTTLEWEPENDDAVLKIIEQKMAAGVTFYLIAKRTPGQRGRVASPKKLKNPQDALKHRALSIPDADLSKLILEGHGRAVPSSSEPVKTVRRAKTPAEVATGHSVGVQPRRGG